MKSQIFLLATAIIIALLITVSKINIFDQSFAKQLSWNFKNEIIYIVNNFNYSNISDFVNKFKNYSESLGYNFTYVCLSNINLSMPKCSNNVNCCCYYNRNELIIKDKLWICKKNIFLVPVKSWVCFCYKIENDKEKVIDFFCT